MPLDDDAAGASAGAGASLQVAIRGMHCAACVDAVTRAARETPGVREAEVNFATRTARVVVDPSFRAEALVRRIREAGYAAELAEARYRVEGLDCPSCVAPLEDALRKLPEVARADVSFADGALRVLALDAEVGMEKARQAVRRMGYRIEELSREEGAAESDRSLVALAAAAAAGAAIAMLPMVWPAAGALALQLPVATAVQLGCGWPIHASFARSLARRRANMNTLISLGTFSAYLYSLAAIAWPAAFPSEHIFFETSSMILAIVLIGRVLEQRARHGTTRAVEGLIALAPRTATVVRDGREERVAAGDVAAGDLVRVRPGDRLPVDGAVEEGRAAMDESAMTGESLPRGRGPGDRVFSGTVPVDGTLLVRASKPARESALAEIVRLVRNASGSKAEVERLADRVSAVFVPLILLLAAATFGAWAYVDSVQRGAVFATAVLIVACPCALGLATPTAVVAAIGAAARSGILFKEARALEEISRTTVAVFDKTGTLTEGRPSVAGELVLDPAGPRAAAALEKGSSHPLARAIREHVGGEPPDPEGFASFDGLGVTGRVDGREAAVGSAEFMAFRGVEASPADEFAQESRLRGRTVVYAAVDGRLAAAYALEDRVKPEARAALREFASEGADLAMLTGDHEATAVAVADRVGIPRVVSGVMPQDKVKEIRKLQEAGGRVLFVGDGINDAPALAQADVGVALSSGQDIAVQAGDVVVVGGFLRRVPAAWRIGRRARAVILQNLMWALGYNLLLVPAAAGALFLATGVALSPMMASAAMALSSITVVTNSLRLRRAE